MGARRGGTAGLGKENGELVTRLVLKRTPKPFYSYLRNHQTLTPLPNSTAPTKPAQSTWAYIIPIQTWGLFHSALPNDSWRNRGTWRRTWTMPRQLPCCLSTSHTREASIVHPALMFVTLDLSHCAIWRGQPAVGLWWLSLEYLHGKCFSLACYTRLIRYVRQNIHFMYPRCTLEITRSNGKMPYK